MAIDDRDLLRARDGAGPDHRPRGRPDPSAETRPRPRELLPNAELIMLASEEELLEAIPTLVGRVSDFLGGEP